MKKYFFLVALIVSVTLIPQASSAANSQTLASTQTVEEAVGLNQVVEQKELPGPPKRKKKKKKKNPVVRYVVLGVLAVATILLYIATDGEGYNSRG